MLRNATALDLSTAVVELVSDLSFARDGTGLASIRCTLLGQNVLFGSLIEKSVSTLESLDYYDGCFDNMRSLVIGQNGDPLVYPKLKNLIVGNDECGPFGDKVRIDSSIVPFPALRYLMWRSVYIFEDDALFRGNSDTLEYLDIEVDIDLVQTLHRLAVFAPGKYSRLCYVAVTYCQPSPDKYLEIDEYVRFVIGLLSPTTTVLSLTRYFHNMVVADADSLCFGNIQTLTLTGFCGTQYVLLDIVKLFPRMTRLTCAQGSLVADLRGRQIRSYDDLHTEYYPLSSSFRHWEAVPGLVRDVKAIAHMALLFTILCPNFELTYVSSEFSKKFEQFMRRTIRSGRHKDHADRLQHLLRIMD
ncbi:hypothetical protein EV175_000544 [Coemansia sp. RSA 1933]|nr:hypothetical protein EV175_000544 [Coemansia sp. RSA 1933]